MPDRAREADDDVIEAGHPRSPRPGGLLWLLVLAQTAMPTAVYAKGFGNYVPAPGRVTYFGGSIYPPASPAPAWGWRRPMIPQPGWGGGYVPGAGAFVNGQYYYPYYYPYYYQYYYPNYYPYYYRMPR